MARGKIAFIGTREYKLMPEPWRRLYEQAVGWAVEWGYTVASGAATGADQAAVERALEAGGRVTLYLPAPDFREDWVEALGTAYGGQVQVVVYNPFRHATWRESVRRYHPAPEKLSAFARQLMARNYGIVEGAKAVIAIPRRRRLANGQESLGGTEQGIRIAQALGVPALDLSTPEGRGALREKMARHPGREEKTT